MSDGEEHAATPNKRPYSTMPINRGSKSPRKSIYGILPPGHGSLENVPPLPVNKHHPSQSPGSGVEPARVQLSPLSNNELNGTSRQASVPPTTAAGGFTTVKSGSFTAVNNAPTLKSEFSRDGSQQPSHEARPASPTSRDGRAYTSPYDPSAANAAAKRAPESSSAPPQSAPPAAAPSQAAHATSAADVNGAARRESPANRSAHHAPIAPQPQPHAYPHPSHTAHPHAQEAQGYAHFAPQAQPRAQHHLVSARGSSRASSPSNHHIGRSLAPHPTSRSNTPLAQVASNKPLSAAAATIAPAPAVQTAQLYGMSLVPTQGAPAPAVLPPSQPTTQPAPQHHQPRHAPGLKNQVPEAAPVVARPATVSTVELRALQCEVTAMLLHWLFPKASQPPDEAGLLHRINTLWYHGEPMFRPELGAHFDLTSHVLTAWLQERYAIASLQHALATHPGLPSSSAAIIDRLLAMNDLRAMRLKWKNMSPVDGMSPEDILIRAFCVMTMTEHTEFVFKEGLSRVERNVFEFLRTEDAKIILHRQ